MVVADSPRTAEYRILAVPVSVCSDVPDVLAVVDGTYAAFRHGHADAACAPLAYAVLREDDAHVVVVGADGTATRHATAHAALLDLLDRMVLGVLGRLGARGIDAIHAGAVVHRGTAAIVAGPSGHGKTTLTLGLVARGAGLLSDEFAVLAPAGPEGAPAVVPYRRSVHIRPGTPELVPALRFVEELDAHALGGGIEWSVTQEALERELPGCLGDAAPLGHVLLLDARPDPSRRPSLAPVPAAVATMELLRGTYTASLDFAAALRRVGAALRGVPCARVRPGALEPTLDLVTAWMDRPRA